MDLHLPEYLAERLAQPLPGPAIAARFGPPPHHTRHFAQPPSDARQAAVLVLLYPYHDQWHVPLTLRPTHLPDHAGQISLPGGALEPGETPRQAALREFHEELGAADQAIRLLGRLSPIYVHVSNFRVEPWVGLAEQRPEWSPNPAEVERLLEVPLKLLLDPETLGRHERSFEGQPYLAPHFACGPHRIWGATCLILGELVTLLEGQAGT